MKFTERASFPYIIILLMAIASFWPMSLMMYSVKNDAINYFLAMRFNISEAIQYGHFPAWSPYINLGYPMHGDVQSGVWNPVVILMSLIRQYDIYWLHVETLLVISLAGFFMYRLCAYLKLDKQIRLLVAVAYMLSGYMTDAGQFINWLYSGALLPLVTLCLLRCFHTFSIRDSAFLGASFAMMLLCGYPADTILTGYIILAWTLVSLIAGYDRRQPVSSLWKFLKVGLVATFVFALLTLPALLSFWEYFDLVRRGRGVSLDMALSNSLAPANLISVAYPWATLKGNIFSETDPLIRNCFFGIIPLVFLFRVFWHRQLNDRWKKFLTALIIFFTLFALGRFTPLREWTFHLLPMMDTFRHPANAKLFIIFGSLLLAGMGMDHFKKELPVNNRRALIPFHVLGAISAGILVVSIFKSRIFELVAGVISPGSNGISDHLKSFRDSLSTWDFLLLNSLLVLLTCLISAYFIRKNKFWRYAFWISAVEMFLIAQFFLPLTYVRNYRVAEVQAIINDQPKGFVIPDTSASLAENSVDGMKYFKEIGCLNVYNKKIGRSDYIISPSNPELQEEFWENKLLREKVMSKPFVYIADTIFSPLDEGGFIANPSVKDALYSGDIGNFVRYSGPGSFTWIQFGPNRMKFNVQAADTSLFVLHQNFYPRWKATINGEPADIHLVNGAFMGIFVGPGNHELMMIYDIKTTRLLSLLSAALFLFLVLIGLKKRKEI